MNWQLFSSWGYLSVALWLVVPMLWLLHTVRRPRRWLCHYAVLVGLVALLFATINSRTYVDRIRVDRSEELAAAQARQEAARRAAEESRAGEVAHVRFAEDDDRDYLDEGGMDDADRKYMDTFDEAPPQASHAGGQASIPEWKKKRARSQTREQDDSLEALLDPGSDAEQGVDTEVVEEEAREPIMMPEKQKMLANRLDGLNLKLIRWLILMGVGVVMLDYLQRVNRYEDAYLPLPLPSAWVDGLTPVPPVRSWPQTPRRTLPEELAWLARKGDTFLYVTDDTAAAAAIPAQTWRIACPQLLAVDIIHVTDDNPVALDFIFETLWYGRSSFVVDSAARAEALLARMLELLEGRKVGRAHVRQSVHVVWDLSAPPAHETVAAFARLGAATGVVLVMKG